LLFWLGGRWGAIAALVLGVAALISMLLELAFLPNPLRWILPKGIGRNVWVRVPAHEQRCEQAVLVAHLDTHRTPLVFSTDGWLRLFRALVPVGLGCALALLIVFTLGLATGEPVWRLVSLPFALVVLALCLLTLQADLSPYAEGANDNASGVGIALSLATRLKARPLTHTAVWILLSGCEEVGSYGAEAFIRTHGGELGRAAWITVDNVGGAGSGPAYLTQETFLLSARSDPSLLALAEELAKRRPELGSYPSTMAGAYTDGAIGAKHGLRILTFVGHRRDGTLPDWHRTSDVLDRLDPSTVERSEAFIWELLQEIDRQACPPRERT